jgi:hypothetical protein
VTTALDNLKVRPLNVDFDVFDILDLIEGEQFEERR